MEHVNTRVADKSVIDAVVPYPESFFVYVRRLQAVLKAAHGFVFPAAKDPERSIPPDLLYQRIMKAERHAGLPKLKQGGTHPYRRKWRSKRSALPLKAAMAAGGWRDLNTMIRCYDQPDEAEILAVTSVSTKRRSSASTSR